MELSAERVVTRRAILQLGNAEQEPLFGAGKLRRVGTVFATSQRGLGAITSISSR